MIKNHWIGVLATLSAGLAVQLCPGLAQESPSSDRYRPRDPASLTVPRRLVTRSDYVDFVRPRAAEFMAGPDHSKHGPRHALGALAVFAFDGDLRLGAGIKQTLRHYANWVYATAQKDGGVFSEEGAALCAFYFRELRKRGLMSLEDEQGARGLMLTLCKYQYAWKPGDGLWRGSQHRAQAQGIAHALVAMFYPNEPEAAQWSEYANKVWGDWWDFRDVGINDTGYYFSSLSSILRGAALMERTEVFTDAQSRQLFDRLMSEVTPDGAVIPYGSSDGYNAQAGLRIFALELAARYTRDGRYRWVAHRLMNHLQARTLPGYQLPKEYAAEEIALTSLICDDSIVPREPKTGSQLLARKEIIRPTNAEITRLFPNAGGLDSGMYMTQRTLPSKLVLRSGWKPGDLFLLAECYTRHDPLNPTAILGLERYSAAFAEMTSEKSISRENAVHISDLSNTAIFMGHKGPSPQKTLPWGWTGMESTVPALSDHATATHALIEVTHYMGYEATHKREFLFVKNRFVLVRDETIFNDSFHANIGPVWNTQNVSEIRGHNWINTWFTNHTFYKDKVYDVPPWDLLIYYAPKPAASLTVESSTIDSPAQGGLRATRYGWTGHVQLGQRVQFVQVLLPHSPVHDATRLAQGITVLTDKPGVTAVSIREGEISEIAVLNPEGKMLNLATQVAGNLSTDARVCYLKISGGQLQSCLGKDTMQMDLNGRPLHRSAIRKSFETVR